MKIIRPLLASLGIALVALASPIQSTAALLLYDNFESYTIGDKPVNPSDGNNNLWYFHSTLNASVINGTPPGGDAPNSKVLRVSKANTGGYTSYGRLFDKQTPAETELIKVTFTIQFHSFSDSAYYIQLADTTAPLSTATSAVPVNLRITSTGQLGISTRADAPGAGTVLTHWNPQGGALRVDDWYQFEITLNLNTQKFDIIIQNLTTPTQHGRLENIYFNYDTTAIGAFLIRSEGTNASPNNLAHDWSLNDIKIESIPEPGPAALGLISIAFLARRATRLRRSGEHQGSPTNLR